jgi:xylose isomerase
VGTGRRTTRTSKGVARSPLRQTRASPVEYGGQSIDEEGNVAAKTSLGIWALGPMVTRFVPGGYQPERAGDDTVRKVRRAVDGLGELIDDYEFHYPQELSEENVDAVRDALDGHGIYCVATGLHLDPRFGKGGLCSPDDGIRDEAIRRTLAAAEFAGELGAHFIIWPGIEGYNYPFQTPYAESWARLIDGIGQAAVRCADKSIKLFLEHKNSEPAMKIHMGNVGMTLHVIHKLRAQGIDNVQVNMDWQHLIMNGENLAEYAALLAAEGLLGHQHGNSGWGTFDDDNMVGATAFMETLELALELRRAGYGSNGERVGFDLYPYTEDQVAAVRRSVLNWRWLDEVAGRIDENALRSAQQAKDAVRANELVFAALGQPQG